MGMILGGKVDTPNLPTLHSIADACGVERPWLVYGAGITPSESLLADLEARAKAWREARSAANADDLDEVAEKGAA